jgi:aromatic ring-opening dioxygenase catalytic subunit (LigB family)
LRDAWSELENYLLGFANRLPQKPRALLVVSGHWEEDRPTVNAGAAPALLFDYGGFPDHTYQWTWPAPGSPALAQRVRALLALGSIESGTEQHRGWDHGVFVPLKVAFPCADIPMAQLSLHRGLDPVTHLEIGRALKPLRGEGVLIVGSGQSYHNMHGCAGRAIQSDPEAEAFDAWLREALTDGAGRDRALIAWEQAPYARHAQPHGDHLLPLMVAAGAASGEPGHVDFHGHAFGKPISDFRFGRSLST